MLNELQGAATASGAGSYRVAELRQRPPNAPGKRFPSASFAAPKSADAAKPQTPASQPKVAILLCTYQGQHYLEEQLMSLQAQTHRHWVLYVSDDGSSDDTHHILNRYEALLGTDRMWVKEGPLEGFASNFLSLTSHGHPQADYYAFSDQDDVWEADKLERAVAWLQTIAADMPALYCSRTRIVDQHDVSIGLSPLFEKPPCFANALVQNIGGGNTMVFNEAARQLIAQTTVANQVVSHDWWAYMLVSACGGAVRYDPYPSVRYRQHANNLVGSNNSWRARLSRIRMLTQGRFKRWNDQNVAALQSLEYLMTSQSRQTLHLFAQARQASVWTRLISLKRSGVKRQTWFSQISLFVAALFGKI